MADISNELQAIMDAVYGEEVRGSIHDALEKMNENAEAAERWATGGSGGTASATNNAKAYAERAEAAAASLEVDDTLSVSGKAADAQVAGVEIEQLYTSIGYAVLDVENGIQLSKTIDEQGLIHASSEFGSCDVVRRRNWKYITITSSLQRNSYISFLTGTIKNLTNSTPVGDLFCEGETGRRQIPKGRISITFEIPDDCKVINIMTKSSGYSYVPDEVVASSNDSGLYSEIQKVIETTRNIAPKDFTSASAGFLYWRGLIPAGTYTVAVNAYSDKPSVNSVFVKFLRSTDYSSDYVMSSVSFKKNTTEYATITVDEDIQSIFMFAGSSVESSSGYPVTLNEFQITEGTTRSPIIASEVANDEEARNRIWLETTNDETDRTAEIEAALEYYGRCCLGKGVFYTTGITMPKSSLLTGCGDSTRLILSDESFDYTIKMGSKCSVSDLTIVGASSNISLDGNILGAPNPNRATNLWTSGDVTVESNGFKHLLLPTPLTPGYYTIFATITSDAPTNSYIGFSTSQTTQIGSATIVASETFLHNGTVRTKAVYIPETVYSIRFCSGDTVASSSGYEAFFTNIAIYKTGSRIGILWDGTDESVIMEHGSIHNCRIIRFDCAGIVMQNTGTPIYRNLAISDCFIRNCNAGIYIRKNSEFNKMVNCTITGNYYGYLNRGGNNDISTSGIDGNVVCIQVDDDEGTNGGHGTITGCSMNHANSNNGYGLIVRGSGRMIVSNCNLYFAKILLENTDGNIISGCGFGRNVGWEVKGGGCNIFNGCMARTVADLPITIQDNTQTKIVNCFSRGGYPIELPA